MELRIAYLALVVITCLCFIQTEAMRPSLPHQYLRNIFDRKEYSKYYMDNVVTASSWKLHANVNTSYVCEYVQKLMPTIMGFQGVQKAKLMAIMRCLHGEYKYFLGQSDGSREEHYNPILYRNFRNIKVRANNSSVGTFWLSDTPSVAKSAFVNSHGRKTKPRICNWMKINFGEKVSHFKPVPRRRERILSVLKLLLGKLSPSNRHKVLRKRKRLTYIFRHIFVVNIQLDDADQQVAVKQMEKLKEFLYEGPQGKRSSYSLIFMGDIGGDSKGKVYDKIVDQNWLIDSMEHSSYTLSKNKKQTNFVMRKNLISLMSGYLEEQKWETRDQLPAFASYLTQQSPTKSGLRKKNKGRIVSRRH